MIRKRGQIIDSLELWRQYASPKSSVQWQDCRSAKECARAWLGDSGGRALPDEVTAVLRTSSDFSEMRDWEAEPECLVAFDNFSGPANIDVLLTGKDNIGGFAVAVEAKADESFGPLLGQAFTAALERRLASPSSNGIARIEQLASAILPIAEGRVPWAHHLRYQLLTAAAAALSKATSIGAERAGEFQTSRTTLKNLERNRRDLARFLRRLGCANPDAVFAGKLVGPLTVPGGGKYSNSPMLYFGKAVRQVNSPEALLPDA